VANNNKSTKAAANPPAAPVSRLQRSLLYMGGSVLGLGVIDIVVLLIGEATIGNTPAFGDSPFWATAAFLPEPAIGIGFLFFIVLLIVTAVQRSRTAKDAGK
jgi:hypothetical protein